MDKVIIVFTKNPALGKVKTRLAKTIGDEKALEIFKILLQHTHTVTSNTTANKLVFYSDYIPSDDVWKKAGYTQFIQQGIDLGNKMSHAFKKAFELGYKKVIIVGSDCLELTSELLNEAFLVLEKEKVVIGPAKDGGYYLLGMQEHYTRVFENKAWSTETVLKETIEDLLDLKIPYVLIKTLSDIDEEKDLLNYPHLL